MTSSDGPAGSENSGAALRPPLVPADADLRDYPFVPIFRVQLFNSSFNTLASDSEWRAGFTLWLKSWDQVPAGTLPDDDRELCRLADLGRDVESWLGLKDMALRGWFPCSDGRLHHRVVAEHVLVAWLDRLGHRFMSGAGNAKRWGAAFDAEAIEAQIESAREHLRAINPQSRSLTKKRPSAGRAGSPLETDPDPDGMPPGSRGDSHRDPDRKEESDAHLAARPDGGVPAGSGGTVIRAAFGEAPPQGGPPAEPKPKRKRSGESRGTRVPDGELPEEWMRAANQVRQKHGMPLLPRANLNLRWEAFQNYWRGLGPRGVKSDWLATWKNNCVDAITERKFPLRDSDIRAGLRLDTTG